MEEVLCNKDGKVCMMKTGTKDGPNKGKSFYICISSGCGFTQNASVKPSHCINHADSMVELQAITHDLREQNHRLYYRCVVGKAAGQKWCGHVPWTPAEKENQNPLSSDRPLQPSFLPPVRNPFKAPDKTDRQDSEWKKMTAPGETEKKGRTASQENGSKESNGGTEDAHSRSVEDEDSGRSNSSDSYRGKHLPPGMKVKKRVSNEERSVAESDGEKNVVSEVKEKTRDGHRERSQEVKNSSTSSVDAPHADGACTIPPSPDGASTQQPTGAIKTTETREETGRKTKESASDSSPVGITQVGPQEETSLSSGKPTKPHATHSKEQDESRSDNARTPVVDDDDDDDDDDVLLVSVKPATGRTPPVTSVQKTLTAFSGFRQSSLVKGQQEDPRELHSLLSAQLKQKKATLSVVNVSALPDKGERLKNQVQDLEDALESLSITLPETSSGDGGGGGGGGHHAKPAAAPCQSNPFSRQGGTVLLPCPPAPPGPLHLEASGGSSQGYSHYGAQSQEAAFYGGRMTDHRLLAVKNATSEAIDHLHKSMESCPGPDTEVPDPKGIKVTLLAHQRKALAWLLWRENQKPCGGILADDMGLGKTLTVIALILAQKKKTKEEDHKDNAEQLDSWISKNDSGLVVSKGTLIICPASLIHHWKNEIDRHVKTGKLSVYLYHGANRQRNARVLANHDVVVTTYSLVSKEIPVQKEDAERPSTDSDKVPSNSGALLRVAWARVVLDEAHNIKNPKVQQSQAACRLRAQARWAVTGTPIQNNLLDMYSLLKFLRCAPFDEYKLWKAQVDNGSKRGGERLNLLTKSLLLRRTKDQRDSAGNPLVYLPDRTCEVHRVKLSEDEMAVYNVVFAQSRSTLQNYLNRHEGNDVNTANTSTSNPFDKVAQEFGLSQSEAAVTPSSSQQKTTGVHILSLLLRLRQCCCHLSLLKKTLDQTELQGDGIILSLEEQLNALCLSSSSSPSPSAPDHQDTVSLNGSHFPSQLFESTSESTKISAVMTELKAIKQKGDDQKSVIVSQWTSMLRIVAVHLQKLGLSYAVIDGSVIPKKRMDLVDDFNTNPKGPQVMLVSLCAGGVGLNLIGGNHLFLVDMHWNPALEDQACDRIYRVGQRKDCTIHRFVCEGTVEDKISILQAKKKELAQKVLSGTGSSVTKLSLADLRVIFGI